MEPPLPFHSVEFVFAFLPIVAIGYFILGRLAPDVRWPLGWMLVASLLFYGWGDQSFVLLIVGSTIFNFLASRCLARLRAAKRERTASSVLTAGIVANLLVLGYFKYANFFADNLGALLGIHPVSISIALPLAISFFTLQQIAYLVDVRRGFANEPSFLRYMLFVTFFPQLIAGPIVHHTEMLPQFREHSRRVHAGDMAEGLSLFILGLAKKIIFADTLAEIADPVFASADSGGAPSFFFAWFGLLAFSFQIYFDFSAYSDMAIGLARMFSIRLPMNFMSPYKATSVIDFWRRWHMTLSRFLRDYVYIPLGGNRLGPWRHYCNLILTMLIGGLWHGASWAFVVWGGLHGLYLVINHLWEKMAPSVATCSGRIGRLAGATLTFLAVTVAWIFFRAETFEGALAIFRGIVGGNGVYLPELMIARIPWLALFANPTRMGDDVHLALPFAGNGFFVLVTALIVFFSPTLHEIKPRTRLILIALFGGLVVQGVIFGRPTEFIYFRF